MASIFDPADKGLTRAPVDDFFAGPNSAVIDDEDWLRTVSEAEQVLGRRRGGKKTKRFGKNLLAAVVGGYTGIVPRGLVDTNGRPNGQRAEGGSTDRDIRETVHDKTGMFIYPGQSVDTPKEDVVFMQEYDDSGASLSDGWRDQGGLPETLGGLLQHEELYKHYPELANMPLSEETDQRYAGSYGGVSEDAPMGGMSINKSMDDNELIKTILHESQHYIQDLEGWPGGGAPGAHNFDSYTDANPKMAEAIYSQWDNAKTQSEADQIEEEAGVHAYQNIAGEILARDVESRFDKRNQLNYAKDSLFNPENPGYSPRSDENRDSLLGKLESRMADVNSTYPYSERDMSNSYPHEMPIPKYLSPKLIKNAMANREGDEYADEAGRYAESLLRDALIENALK